MVQANGAFIDARLQLLEQFKKDLKVHFDAEFQEADFTNDLIDPSSIDASVDMMLANAIYFKGMSSMTWSHCSLIFYRKDYAKITVKIV